MQSGFALHVGVRCDFLVAAILVQSSTMPATKQATELIELPPQPVSTPSPPTSPPPQPRTRAYAAVRRPYHPPLLPSRSSKLQ